MKERRPRSRPTAAGMVESILKNQGVVVNLDDNPLVIFCARNALNGYQAACTYHQGYEEKALHRVNLITPISKCNLCPIGDVSA